MNTVFKIFLSMSFSGGLVILALLLGKQFLKDKISRQWQYYIWLVVVLRLLLPFGPEINLLGKTYQALDQAITRDGPLPAPQQSLSDTQGSVPVPAAGTGHNKEDGNSPMDGPAAVHPFQDIETLLTNHVWLVWPAVAVVLLIRKITIYQSFIRYIKAGVTPISDLGMLDRLSMIAEQASVKKPVELCVNPLISSPLLTGFFNPCIVLPNASIPEKDFQYIVLHELTHYKRRDIYYKWLVQITVCLHWFNPLVHLMSREITRACEFSCDEAVLARAGNHNAQDYGKTLLDVMAAIGRYRENPGAVSFSKNKQLLKARLGAIMKYKEQSMAVKILTATLTLCVVLGASFVGIYTMGNAGASSLPNRPPDTSGSSPLSPDISSAAVKVPETKDMDQYDEAGVKTIPIDFKTVEAKEAIFLGEYTLSFGDKIYYDILAETGNAMTVFFARDKEKNTFYWAAHNQRQPDGPLKCTADFTVGPPSTKPGTYKLYLQADEGALGNVTGSISIVMTDAS